jgi:hypothetical protein
MRDGKGQKGRHGWHEAEGHDEAAAAQDGLGPRDEGAHPEEDIEAIQRAKGKMMHKSRFLRAAWVFCAPRATLFTAAMLSCGLAGCTTDPAYNTGAGGVGGAAAGCAIGAAVTAPLFGVGCVPGAIIGGSAGAAAGLASTPTPPPYAAPGPYPEEPGYPPPYPLHP